MLAENIHFFREFVDYERMSALKIFYFGAAYLSSSNYRRMIEHRTDKLTIDRGFGNEVHAFVKVLEENISGSYQKLKERVYLDADEISLYIQSLEEPDVLPTNV